MWQKATIKSISMKERGPLVISNYSYEKISDNNFKFIYFLQRSEFKKAGNMATKRFTNHM
jgi:hypothetical protein